MIKQTRTIAFAMMAITVLSFIACTDKDSDPQDQASQCKIKGLGWHTTEIYNNQTYNYSDSILFQYDDNNRLFRWIEEGDYIQFTYNSSGQLLKEEYYEETILDGYGDYTYSGNSVTVVYFYQNENNTWISNLKTVYTLNSFNQIEKLEDFEVIDGEWMKSRYYINTWLNGNLVTQEAYELEYSKGNNSKNQNKFRRKQERGRNKQLQKNTRSTNDTFVKYRTSTFTYDSKYNPFSNIEAFRFYTEGDAFFNAKNNVVTETIFNYWNSEYEETDLYNYGYLYNQYNFPIKMNISNQSENSSWASEWNYAYECE